MSREERRMVDTKEFRTACERARNRIAYLDLLWFGVLVLLVGGLGSVGYAWVGVVAHPIEGDRVITNEQWAFTALGAIVILLAIAAEWRRWHVPQVLPGMHVCSRCQTRLFALPDEPIVVASRNCLGCGATHLADPVLDDHVELIEEPDYRKAAKQFQQRLASVLGLGLLAWLLSCLLTGFVARFVGRNWVTELLPTFTCFGPPLVCGGFAAWLHHRVKWDDRLRCRWCNTALANDSQLLVAVTRNCPHCSKPILAEGEPEPTPEHLLSPTELAHRQRMSTTHGERSVGRASLAMVVLAALWSALLYTSWGRARMPWALVATSETRLQSLLFGLGGGFIVVLVAFVMLRSESARRRWPMVCVACRKGFLNVPFVIATRHCDRCGKRTLRDDA
jgi:hypothetical protein